MKDSLKQLLEDVKTVNWALVKANDEDSLDNVDKKYDEIFARLEKKEQKIDQILEKLDKNPSEVDLTKLDINVSDLVKKALNISTGSIDETKINTILEKQDEILSRLEKIEKRETKLEVDKTLLARFNVIEYEWFKSKALELIKQEKQQLLALISIIISIVLLFCNVLLHISLGKLALVYTALPMIYFYMIGTISTDDIKEKIKELKDRYKVYQKREV